MNPSQKDSMPSVPEHPTVTFDGMTMPPFGPLRRNVEERFDAIRKLETKDDDVILVAYPKSGTHWVWEITNMLIKGLADYEKNTKEIAMLEAVPELTSINSLNSPRVLNTHLPYRWLPKKHLDNGGKIVHVVRNPKDVVVSMYHHLKSAHVGGPDFTEYYQQFFFSPVKFMGGWFDYIKEYEDAEQKMGKSSMITLHYEDLKKTPIEAVTKLAKFLGVTYTDSLIEEIVDKCSFAKLKEADEKVKIDIISATILSDLPEEFRQTGYANRPIMYRKGEIGDWKNHFTADQSTQFDQLFSEEMKNSNMTIKFE